MVKRKAKGSIIYEILIILLVIVLVATLLYPKSVWNKIERESILCQDQMHRIIEAEALYISFQGDFKYDSSLVNVIEFVKNESLWQKDSIMVTMRDTFQVRLLVDYFRNYQDMATKVATDSAFFLVDNKSDSIVAMHVDSIFNNMLDKLYTCPTTGDSYHIEVVDTSSLKVLKVFCPIDSTDILSVNEDFWFQFIGGGELKNHGNIDNNEISWEEKKRK